MPQLGALAKERADLPGQQSALGPRHQSEDLGPAFSWVQDAVSILIEVDLPAPFGPIKASRSPRSTRNDRLFTASSSCRFRRGPVVNTRLNPSATMAAVTTQVWRRRYRDSEDFPVRSAVAARS